MKLNINKIGAMLAFVLTLGACEDKLEENYLNPEATVTGSIEKFFTKMLDNNRVRPSYAEVRTFLLMHPALYTQSVSFTNDAKRYQQQIDYTQSRWEEYYRSGDNGSGVLAHYREMEKLYGTLTGDAKTNAEIFMHAGKVVLLDQTIKMVDLWGDIPFSQAGSLNLTGTIVYPEFDDAKTIYDNALQDLETAANFFAGIPSSAVYLNIFKQQDILLKGSVGAWRRYINSLRLRILMRISFVEEERAKAEVLEMLADPAKYPLTDDAQYDVLLDPLTTYTSTLKDALRELYNYPAPEYLLENYLKPANDPRIHVMFDRGVRTIGETKIPNEDYFSMPVALNSNDQIENITAGRYASIDSTTFWENRFLPGIVMTSSEVNFLKAEAFERWGGGDAAAAYEIAVKQSVDFYYMLSATNNGAETEPAEDAINDLVANPVVVYTGTTDEKLRKIWGQKWVHFGFLQSIEGWAEMRRTNYPVLNFVPDDNTPGFALPPNRLTYPNSEKLYNSSNYAKVAAEDRRDNKIFWDVN